MPEIRPGEACDLEQIAAIQAASPEASQWDVRDYLRYELRVSADGNRVLGFLVTRTVESECEILNLVVAPEFRRRGVAKCLVESLLNVFRGSFFLEVRSSNQGARSFYKFLGFQEVGTRPEYYADPPEAAIVMKFHSC